MSFILDALRKSEHARQKQTGPGFAEVPVVAAKPKTNVWATAAVVLLLVNLIAVGVLLLRRASQDEATPVATNEPAATAMVAASGPDAALAPAADPAAAIATGPTLTAEAPGAATAAPSTSPPRAAATGRNPLAEEVGDAATDIEPSVASAAAAVPAGPPAVTRQGSAPARRGGSVVYTPMPEANDAPYSPPPAAPAAPTSDGLPTADEVTARGGVPELHLDLHVYAAAPAQRFIFVNSRKYREGDALQEGPVVEQITATGAVLSYRGSRFKLSND